MLFFIYGYAVFSKNQKTFVVFLNIISAEHLQFASEFLSSHKNYTYFIISKSISVLCWKILSCSFIFLFMIYCVEDGGNSYETSLNYFSSKKIYMINHQIIL